MYRVEEHELTYAIEEYLNKSETFDFLHKEEELYTDNDLKERYG